MATYTKPTTVPEWAVTGTRTEPSAGKKNTGWIFEESPPYDFFNWLQGISGDWFNWINERLGDGTTADELRILSTGGLEIGSSSFLLKHDGTDPYIIFAHPTGTPDQLWYDKSANELHLQINATDEVILGQGLRVGSVITSLPGSGSAIFGGGINVGFDATPSPDRINVFDANFGMQGSANTPNVFFDSGDVIQFNRSSNLFSWFIGGVSKGQVNDAGFFGNRFTARSLISVATSQDILASRHQGNCVLAQGVFYVATPPNADLLGTGWNINGNAINVGTGVYDVTLDQPVEYFGASCHVTLTLPGTTPKVAQASVINSGTQVRIEVFRTSTGVAVDLAGLEGFNLAVLGAPLTPTAPF
jgi:hypothetical protein